MLEFVANTNIRLPVVLKDLSSQPIAGAVYNAIAFSILKADGTEIDITVVSASWAEITGAAYSGQGYYNYVLTSSYTNLTGIFQYAVSYTGSAPYFGVVKLVDGDTGAVFNRLGPPNYGTIANDIANVGVTAGSGGFTSADRAAINSCYTATLRIPSDPASQSGTLSIVTQSFWTGDRQNLTAIKAKTDNLPSDPASQGTTNSSIASARDNVNGNTNNGFGAIEGAGWSAGETLHNIYARTSSTLANMATQAFLSFTFGTITGAGFTTGADDLHNLSIQIQGITPSSGGGGFSTTDRTTLVAIYSSSINLPGDPTSWATVSGALRETKERIMGMYPYGATTGASPNTLYSVASTLGGVNTTVGNIWTYASRIPTTPASQGDVTSARDYLAGAGYASVSNSLYAISQQFTSGNFSLSDRTMLQSISSSVGSGLTGSVNGLVTNVAAIKGKTDLLPNDVVSTAHIDPKLDIIISASAVSGGYSVDDRTALMACYTATLRIPTHPADGDVTFNNSDRAQLNNVYSKTDKLPVDPVSTTYLTLVSQSLAQAISSSYSGTTSNIANLSGAMSSSFSGTTARLTTMSATLSGVGATASATLLQATAANSNALQGASYANTAAGYAGIAATNTDTIGATLGTPASGTLAADIAGVAGAVVHVSGAVASASVDLSPITKKLGDPITTISRDILEVARLVKMSLTGTRR